VAGLTVVLLEDGILYSLHLSGVSVHAHFLCFIVKEIHVNRISTTQNGKNTHALRQKHILFCVNCYHLSRVSNLFIINYEC